MTQISKDRAPALAGAFVGLVALLFATGCSLLPGDPAPAPSFFTLQPTFAASPATGSDSDAANASDLERAATQAARVILVAPPSARPGFDVRRMAYVRRPFELRYFASHQWVEPPARLLEPLLSLVLERGGRFRPLASGALVDPALRLETEIVVLQQEFGAEPSRVRFVLSARLIDSRANRLVATTELEALEQADSDDPYGGVVAANRAVARVLESLAEWCDTQATRAGSS